MLDWHRVLDGHLPVMAPAMPSCLILRQVSCGSPSPVAPAATWDPGRGDAGETTWPFLLGRYLVTGSSSSCLPPSEMRRGHRERSARLCLCTQGISYTTPTRFLTHVSSLLSPGGRCHLHLRDGSVTELSLCILQSPPRLSPRGFKTW